MATSAYALKAYFLFLFINNEWAKSIKSEIKSANPAKIRERNLLFQIEVAKSHGKLSQGVWEVWNSALQKKGRVLIAEKEVLFPAKEKTSIMDCVIEKVMAGGGNVEFVENGVLKTMNE